jgi:hypothetical protein
VNAVNAVNAGNASNGGNEADLSSLRAFPAMSALSLLLRPGDVTLPGPNASDVRCATETKWIDRPQSQVLSRSHV